MISHLEISSDLCTRQINNSKSVAQSFLSVTLNTQKENNLRCSVLKEK